MINGLRKVSMTVLLVLPVLIAGCGKAEHSHLGGGSVAKKDPGYKAQDQELITRSNSIPVYSSPDNARRAMRRQPDDIVKDGNGNDTLVFNADSTPNSEQLRLKYQNGRLIGKEIVPPDANADSRSVAASRSTIPQSNDANYIDMKEYNPKASKTKAVAPTTPSDSANASLNEDFNAKLNAQTSSRKY